MAHKGEKSNGSHYTSTRRSRKQPQTTAKPKKKISKRAALIKKVEKSGVKLRTDWSALIPKKSSPVKGSDLEAKKRAAYIRKLKMLGILKPIFKKKKKSS